MAVKLQTEGSH